MYYLEPEREEAYQVPNEYYFGSELLVSPITEKQDPEVRAAKATTWAICPPLPTGFADTQPAPTGAQKAPGRLPGQGLLYRAI